MELGGYLRTPWQALKSQNRFVSDFGVHSGRFWGSFGTILELLWWPWALLWSTGGRHWTQKAGSRQPPVCTAICSTADVIPGVAQCHENIVNNKVIARGPLPPIWCKLAPKSLRKGGPGNHFGDPGPSRRPLRRQNRVRSERWNTLEKRPDFVSARACPEAVALWRGGGPGFGF